MKRTRRRAFLAYIFIILAVSSASYLVSIADSATPSPLRGAIYLYGEHHGVEWILQEELELWGQHYNNENMRHLFVELPYYTTQFLNIWMESADDEILDQIFAESEGTAFYSPHVREFYRTIKAEYPETVFHGTDVGHQYFSTGRRYMEYLKQNGLIGSAEYLLTQEIMEQGRYYYAHSGNVYRENKLVENFRREFDKLEGESVMGIYGGAHTDPDAMDYYTGTVPSMAGQLQQYYDTLYTCNLAFQTGFVEGEQIRLGGKDYEAIWLGKQNLTGSQNFIHRVFWRLENAYDDFKVMDTTGDVLPYNNYPSEVKEGQVFRIDYTTNDGSVRSQYYRSDGMIWNGLPVTEEFVVE